MKTAIQISLFLVAIATSFSQTSSETNVAEGTWYSMQIFSNHKIEITDSLWINEEIELEEGMNEYIDTMFVVKKLPYQLSIMKKGGNKKFALVRNTLVDNGNELHTAILETNSSLDSIMDSYMKYKEPKNTELVNARVLYSEVKRNEIKSNPGMDEMKAEDLLIALKSRQEIGTLLQEYITQHPKQAKRPYYIYRLAEPFLQREFIRLGYNPYKQVAHNFEKQFKDHPEIIKLLTEPF